MKRHLAVSMVVLLVLAVWTGVGFAASLSVELTGDEVVNKQNAGPEFHVSIKTEGIESAELATIQFSVPDLNYTAEPVQKAVSELSSDIPFLVDPVSREGEYTAVVSVTVGDFTGSDSHVFLVDYSEPVISDATPADGAEWEEITDFSVRVSDLRVQNVTLKVDGNEQGEPSEEEGLYTWTFSSSLAPGRHILAVEATDAADHVSNETYEVTVVEGGSFETAHVELGDAFVGIHEDVIYEAFKLVVDGTMVPLDEGTIDAIYVDGVALTPDIDPYLWFNVQKPAGDYAFRIEMNEDNDFRIINAILDWAGVAEATARQVLPPTEDGVPIGFFNGDDQLDLDRIQDAVYQIAPEVKNVNHLVDLVDDKNLTIPEETEEGTYEFLVMDNFEWFRASVDWPAIVDRALPYTNDTLPSVMGPNSEDTLTFVDDEGGFNDIGLTHAWAWITAEDNVVGPLSFSVPVEEGKAMVSLGIMDPGIIQNLLADGQTYAVQFLVTDKLHRLEDLTEPRTLAQSFTFTWDSEGPMVAQDGFERTFYDVTRYEIFVPVTDENGVSKVEVGLSGVVTAQGEGDDLVYNTEDDPDVVRFVEGGVSINLAGPYAEGLLYNGQSVDMGITATDSVGNVSYTSITGAEILVLDDMVSFSVEGQDLEVEGVGPATRVPNPELFVAWSGAEYLPPESISVNSIKASVDGQPAYSNWVGELADGVLVIWTGNRLADGVHTVSVEVSLADYEGNALKYVTYTKTFKFIVDTTGPVASLVSPADGSWDGVSPVQVKLTDVTGIDRNQVWLGIEGHGDLVSAALVPDTDNVFEVDFADLGPGTYNLIVSAFDIMGIPTVTHLALNVPDTVPPEGHASIESGSLTISATDNIGLGKVILQVNDVKSEYALSGTADDVVVELPQAAGQYIVTVTVEDAAGNQTILMSNELYEVVDLDAPQGSVTIENGILTVSATDDDALMKAIVTINDEDTEYPLSGTEDAVTITLPTEVGSYAITVVVEDASGNRTVLMSGEVYEVLDLEAPQGSAVVENGSIAVTATDNAGLAKVIITINGESTEYALAGTADEFIVPLPTAVGQYTISVAVEDAAGNMTILMEDEVLKIRPVHVPGEGSGHGFDMWKN